MVFDLPLALFSCGTICCSENGLVLTIAVDIMSGEVRNAVCVFVTLHSGNGLDA